MKRLGAVTAMLVAATGQTASPSTSAPTPTCPPPPVCPPCAAQWAAPPDSLAEYYATWRLRHQLFMDMFLEPYRNGRLVYSSEGPPPVAPAAETPLARVGPRTSEAGATP